MREFDDINAMRSNILASVKNAVTSKYPIENDRYRLEVADVAYDTEDTTPIKKQKEILMQNRSLNRKLYGTWKLVDRETGQVVEEKRGIIAHVPDMTNRGTFIRNGTEYVINNQMRLKPGVYTRRKASGDLEAQFNTLPGSGKPFRIHMEPATGIFKMQIGQSHVPLYPILQAQGVSDNQLEKQWGKDLLNANRQKTDLNAVQKVYQRMVSKPEEGETPATGIAREFGRMEMDPDVIERNLGQWMDQEYDIADIK
jgi:DNA-directed RNA polymerase beta subunit